MRDSRANPADHKQLPKAECCDLYGEYCYPCNTTPATATPKEGERSVGKGEKRRGG